MDNYDDIIMKIESCQWIPTDERLPEDKQYCLAFDVNGYCNPTVFYLSFYLDDNHMGCGPANQWGPDDSKVLFWLPIPSVVNLPGVEPGNFKVQREEAEHVTP